MFPLKFRQGALALATVGLLAACTATTGVGTTPGTSGTGSASAVSFKTNVAPMLQQTCAGCHAQGQQGANDLVMFDNAGNVDYSAVRSSIRSMIRQVQSGAMPQGGPHYTTAQINVLSQWSSAGAPNN